MKKLIILILFILISSLCFTQEIHFDWIDANPDTIYADNNITYSVISVRVIDDEEQPVEDVCIRFRTNLGNIITTVHTNENGIAETTFWDSGEVGIAIIEAFIQDFTGPSIRIRVVILPPLANHFDWIEAVPDTIWADDNITYSVITTRIVNENNQPVEYVLVHFQSNIGSIPIYNAYTNEEGLAETTFWDAGDVGTAHITATIEGDEIEVEVEILPINQIDDDQSNLSNFSISPNPSNILKNNRIEIKFSLTQKQNVIMKIYNIKGQFIDTIINTQFDRGNHTVKYNFYQRNKQISSGIYFVTITIGNEFYSRKITIF